jgi:hypothetical protein
VFDFRRFYCSSVHYVRRRPLHFKRSKTVLTLISKYGTTRQHNPITSWHFHYFCA